MHPFVQKWVVFGINFKNFTYHSCFYFFNCLNVFQDIRQISNYRVNTWLLYNLQYIS